MVQLNELENVKQFRGFQNYLISNRVMNNKHILKHSLNKHEYYKLPLRYITYKENKTKKANIQDVIFLYECMILIYQLLWCMFLVYRLINWK